MKAFSLQYLALVSAVLVLVSLTSCRWTPQRDNPVDPLSSFYVPPPAKNISPQIDTIYVTTSCVYFSGINTLSFNIYCVVIDSNKNLDYNSVSAHIDSIFLGYLAYDPIRHEFFVHKEEADLPGGLTVIELTGRPLIITAVDDSGATDIKSISFIEPLQIPLPEINAPREGEIVSSHPRLRWYFWNGPRAHTFEVEVRANESLLWDSAGLLSSDTAVTVTDSLENSGGSLSYTWRLRVRTDQENTITSSETRFGVFYVAP